MEKVFIYYESKNNKENETTNVYIEVFENFTKARAFMNERRNELIEKYGLIPDEIDGNGDKSWVRLYKDSEKNDYVDLITEEKKII